MEIFIRMKKLFFTMSVDMILKIMRRLGIKGDLFYLDGKYLVFFGTGRAEIRPDRRDIIVVIEKDGKKKVLNFRNVLHEGG